MSSLNPLTIVPAGAGAGKTYRIEHEVSRWVEEGVVQPERILAVTFTNVAAAELRERIRSLFVSEGMIEQAQRLDQSMITTIHSFALKVLGDFSFEAELSPRLRQIDDEQAKRMLGQSVNEREELFQFMANLSRYGYKAGYKGDGFISDTDDFKDQLQKTISKLRSIGRDRKDGGIQAEAARKVIRKLYPKPIISDVEKATKRLHDAVCELRQAYPDNWGPVCGKPPGSEVTKTFNRDYRNLRRAEEIEVLGRDWTLWVALCDLRQSKRGSSLPEEYDQLADRVMEAASQIEFHPGPLEDALMHSNLVLDTAMEVIEAYEQHKQQLGLLDYADMLSYTNRLLEDEEILGEVAGQFDCLVIDEFQDTNPLQFELLWKLHQQGIPSFVVGDIKQSIMSVQDAEPFLMEKLQQTNPDQIDELSENWRSSNSLMGWINAVSSGMFEHYQPLEPKSGREGIPFPVECLAFDKSAGWNGKTIKTSTRRAAAVGEHIIGLMQDGEVRGGDVAILCQTNKDVADYSSQLETMGLKVHARREGWVDSKIIQLAIHLLAYVANSEDRHAALYLSVTELGKMPLQDALEYFLFGEGDRIALLEELGKRGKYLRSLDVTLAVSRIIQIAGLYDLVDQLEEPRQERANLDRLLNESRSFVTSPREALESSGFFGSSLSTFIPWLIDRGSLDKVLPQATSVDEHAITVSTWHSSKGREWPIVIVAGMHRDIKSYIPGLVVDYGEDPSLSSVVEDARINFYPYFDHKEAQEKYQRELDERRRDEAIRLLYVAITRAKEKLILEWPEVSTRDSTFWALFCDEAKISSEIENGVMVVDGKEYPCRRTQAIFDAAGHAETQEELPSIRSMIQRRSIDVGLTPDQITPSSKQGSEAEIGVVEKHQYGEGISDVIKAIPGPQHERGILLHKVSELLLNSPSNREMISQYVGESLSGEQVDAIVDSVETLKEWLYNQYDVLSIETEVPIISMAANGSVINGTMDLVVRTEGGLLVIDHKSDLDPGDDAFDGYAKQLSLYREALEGVDEDVISVGVNWMSTGYLYLV